MPEMLGPFELQGEIGRGAMAVVWRAFDSRLRREVAIKEPMVPAWADAATRSELSERFVREGCAAALLNHPGIITIYAADVYEGRPAIVMELIAGETLGTLIGRSPLGSEAALAVLDQLLDAVAYAHAHGVIHRDIKPENIFVTADGRVKLSDFGIASIGAGSSTLTQAGTVMGTPGYMAPEQVRGETADARTDIFAIGAIAYEMLSGRNPFGSTDGLPPTAVMLRVVQDAPAPLETLVPQLPGNVGAAIAKALAKDPNERFATAEELRAVLRDPTAIVVVPPSSLASATPQRAPQPVPANAYDSAGAQTVLEPTAGATAAIPGPTSGSESAASEGAAASKRNRNLLLATVAAGILIVGGLMLSSGSKGSGAGPVVGASASAGGASHSAADLAAIKDADAQLTAAEAALVDTTNDVTAATADFAVTDGPGAAWASRKAQATAAIAAARGQAEKLTDSSDKTDLLAAIDAESKTVAALDKEVAVVDTLLKTGSVMEDVNAAADKLVYAISRANGSSYSEMRKSARDASDRFDKILKHFQSAESLMPDAGLDKWVSYAKKQKARAEMQGEMSADAKAGRIGAYNSSASKSNALSTEAKKAIDAAPTLDSTWQSSSVAPFDKAFHDALDWETDLHVKARRELGYTP